MRKKILVAILFLTVLVVLSAEGATCSPIGSNVFDAALTNPGFALPFANASLSFNGTEATVVANALGLPNPDAITTVALYRGQPGSPAAALIQTFTPADTSVGPQFFGTASLTAAQIAAIHSDPSNHFFVLSTQLLGNVVFTGALVPEAARPILGQLSPSAGQNASVVLTVTEAGKSGEGTLMYEILAPALGNQSIFSFKLLPANENDETGTFAVNAQAVNGRIAGSAPISAALAQQMLAGPCAFSVQVFSPALSNGSAFAALRPGREVFIPVAGSARGADGANFQTDVSIHNRSTLFAGSRATGRAMLQFFPTGGSNVTAQSAMMISMPLRGITMTMQDISSSLFNGTTTGIGALRIVSADDVFANARIYNNQIASGRGTFGQSEPGLFRAQAAQQGLLVGVGAVSSDLTLANGQTFRTNIGFFNPSGVATPVAVQLRDFTGATIGNAVITLGPWMHVQMPLTGTKGLFNQTFGEFASSSVSFISGTAIFAYATVIDNVSGDSSFVTPTSEVVAGN